ncbi:unnamed protein product [Penicillium salamii]|uniref:Uncharacterized protein n=1 Tax=Penicillium salamii TaxID=1612424 RepID=A0A9W4IPG4_9EURO|nr:unnamed protein product [Penicillium salamii]CAG8120741.1 unnamed protein product [Penicillium salamii]CAG8291122.1 unnamed protein product [Penicillium salamii]CAG8343229.1 unnamed protein product [Penicillium salamii]CAG8345075.1 unnamed protein product [Penicillium salamii]
MSKVSPVFVLFYYPKVLPSRTQCPPALQLLFQHPPWPTQASTFETHPVVPLDTASRIRSSTLLVQPLYINDVVQLENDPRA